MLSTHVKVFGLLLGVMLTGCVSAPPAPTPRPSVIPPQTTPAPVSPERPLADARPAETPAAAVDSVPPTPEIPPPVLPPLPPRVTSGLSESQGRELLQQLLPSRLKDRSGWRNDILTAFTALNIPYEAPYFCAAIAVIEQESTWQSDPVVPNLDKIVWKEIEKRADKYHLPMVAVKTALLKSSPDGRSYKARIDALKTEKQMNALFEDLAADATRLRLPLNLKNPIRTGGPMQVSVEFAEDHIRVWPYPYKYKGDIRSEVFSRRGGLYFGIAILLQYRADYPDMIYRFADFNAGRYSSRNAAFQAAVVRLSGRKMALDGDLLNYAGGGVSTTQQQLIALGSKLGLSAAAIERDLKLEKREAFSQTALYQRVHERASAKAGRPLPQQTLPGIRLSSPKITRKLTTEWFAKRVNGRYQTCMARAPAPLPLSPLGH